jgi:BirA family transcriptional regulator, biotin operon repressor / biotin---[acetyl-CoA-carboxylase] ligase
VRLLEFEHLPSTNAYALEHLTQLQHGDVILARTQTAGRGRLQRVWISHHPHNVALSILFKPPHALIHLLPATTHYLAVILCEILASRGVHPTIKWPNDVLVDGRKIAGILAEGRLAGQEFLGMALGLGVNLNLPTSALADIDQPATALNLLLGQPVQPGPFVQQLLDRFFASLDAFLTNGFESIRHEYERRASFLGQVITVRQPPAQWIGTARALDADGALLLETHDGRTHLLRAGDLTFPTPEPGDTKQPETTPPSQTF